MAARERGPPEWNGVAARSAPPEVLDHRRGAQAEERLPFSEVGAVAVAAVVALDVRQRGLETVEDEVLGAEGATGLHARLDVAIGLDVDVDAAHDARRGAGGGAAGELAIVRPRDGVLVAGGGEHQSPPLA